MLIFLHGIACAWHQKLVNYWLEISAKPETETQTSEIQDPGNIHVHQKLRIPFTFLAMKNSLQLTIFFA